MFPCMYDRVLFQLWMYVDVHVYVLTPYPENFNQFSKICAHSYENL